MFISKLDCLHKITYYVKIISIVEFLNLFLFLSNFGQIKCMDSSSVLQCVEIQIIQVPL